MPDIAAPNDTPDPESFKLRIDELEAKLARAEHELGRWHAIFRELPACVAITRGPEHVFEFVNRAYELSTKSHDIIGRKLADAHPVLAHQGLLDYTDGVYQGGVPVPNHELPAEVVLPDGRTTIRYYSGALIPLKDESGQVEGLVNFQFDVTDLVESRKQLEKAHERLAIAAEVGRLGLWEWELEQGFVWRSENFFQVFGYENPVEWSYEIYLQHMHPEDRERVRDLHLRRRQSGQVDTFEIEYRVIWPDGSVHWLKDNFRAIKDAQGRANQVIGATIDITEQKRSEILLNQSKDAAEAANLAKTHFLANMSHELQTPLAAIIGFSSLLRNPELDEERREGYAKAIERNGNALARIIADILDLSKIESGHLDIETAPFDLSSLLKEVHDISQLEAANKNLALSFSLPPEASTVIVTDRGRLRQILLNVIGNAIKFTSAGTVSVEVNASGQRAEFLVRDTGIGISPEDQQKLFQPFTQADSSSSRRFRGTGLGLAISRRLARALGGDLTLVESRKGQGSLFRITIGPLAEQPPDPR